MKQQRQEEKASQKASREAARVLLKLEKERLRTGKDDSSRGISLDRSGSRPIIMRRCALTLHSLDLMRALAVAKHAKQCWRQQ